MTAELPITDADLHAAADGRLPLDRQAEIEATMAGNTDIAARVGFYRRLNAELHAAYDFMLSEPLPDGLAATPQRSLWRVPARVAAAIVLLVAAAASGWLARDLTDEYARPAQALAELAAEAHLVYAAQVRHPVEVPATDKDHLQAWLSKSLARPVHVPELASIGYEFMGGRLLPADRDAAGQLTVAGQLMYQSASGNRVTLYFMPATEQRDSAFRFIEADGLSVWYWHDEKLAYALASELSREQLKAVCNEVYGQLNPGAGPVEW
ncbi:MAG TPA: anti-sigma factor [Alphaproteobacteria bacterium]|nr:anti-sigma factor [Alphaproteobacteria bacterium]